MGYKNIYKLLELKIGIENWNWEFGFNLLLSQISKKIFPCGFAKRMD